MSNTNNFLWLHIKKAGGESFRKTFTPPYIQTDRTKYYKPFIALPKEEWNDALNNYRIPLGEYDYKRMLFAKKFLYSEQEFNSMFKFVIVRNPYDRIVSAWKYLHKKTKNPKHIMKRISFTCFVSDLNYLWETKYNRHNATHTAPIWGDITDENGKLLVDQIIKLEQVSTELPLLCEKIGVHKSYAHINASRKDNSYRKYYNNKSRKIVEGLYADDINQLGYTF
nr:sulfotransferase family 2 domain-containing protein [uncultured Draconibacterium sp.]